MAHRQTICFQHRRHRFNSWVGKITQRRAWQCSIPAFLFGESDGQRSLAATVHRVTKSQTQLKQLNMHTCTLRRILSEKITNKHIIIKFLRNLEKEKILIKKIWQLIRFSLFLYVSKQFYNDLSGNC